MLLKLTLIILMNLVFKADLMKKDSLLLVISLDGFRYDYLDKYSSKNGFLHRLATKGSRASWSEPIFPTNTYPNHWSIVTGLLPEHNGIINNNIYDPVTKEHFKMNIDREDQPGWFDQSEPIWVTYGRKYRNKNSVVIDWPGSSAPFYSNESLNFTYRHPESDLFHIKTFNDSINYFVEKLCPDNTNLAFIYFGEPDMTGHNHGPESREVEIVVKELDYVLEYLFDKMKKEKNFVLDFNSEDKDQKEKYREIELIILTDHGMANIRDRNEFDLNRHLFLSDFINVKKYLDLEKCSYGSVVELWLLDESLTNELYDLIKNVKINQANKLKEVYLKKDIPERFHIKSHRRTSPMILIAHEGFQIMIERDKMDKYSVQKYYGNHGFDNEFKSMRGIFIGYGKSFRKSYYSKKPVKLIDTYPLMCAILGLEPAHSYNGSLRRVIHFLDDEYRSNRDLGEFFRREIIEDENELMSKIFYGGVLLVILIAVISICLPLFSILGSIRATCQKPKEN